MRPRVHRPAVGAGGFTLIEVLVVVIILGIASALIIPSLLSAGSLTLQGAARLVVSDIVYAQNEAVAQHQPYSLVFDIDPDTNRYALFDADDELVHTNWMGHYLVDFRTDRRFNGIRMEAVDFEGEQTLIFDELGSPNNGGYIDLTDGHHHYRVRVAPVTGRVTVHPREDEAAE